MTGGHFKLSFGVILGCDGRQALRALVSSVPFRPVPTR